MADKKYELTGMVTEQANPKTTEMDTMEISELLSTKVQRDTVMTSLNKQIHRKE